MRFPIQSTGVWKFWYIVAIIIKPFFVRLTIVGEEHIPREGGCVAACNHTSGPDYVILGYASTRQVYYMVKSEAFRIHPWMSKLLYALGCFPVRRGKGDSDAIEQAVRVAQTNHVVGMFPEGTRSKTGTLQRGKSGVARIALGAGVPIVPAVVIDSEPILRDWLKFKRRPPVTIRFGPPIEPGGDASNPADVQRLTTKMMLAMAAMLPPERRGYYADPAALGIEDGMDGPGDVAASQSS